MGETMKKLSQFVTITTFLFLILSTKSVEAQAPGGIRIMGHVPTKGISKATHLGRLDASKQMSLTVALNLRNQSELTALIASLHDPKDPLYGQFLTPQQFAQKFGPAPEDMAAIKNYLSANNLKFNGSSTSTIKVSGAVRDVEKVFNLEMHQYQTADNRVVFAPNLDPQVDSSMASKISGILGLNSFTSLIAHRHKKVADGSTGIGTGPGGGMGPSDIQKAYNFSGGNVNGSGQTLALMELDGYTPSDISGYASQFGITNVPLQNVMVDSYNGAAGDGADEVTLDIELMMAVAPGASKILVYEGPNSDTGPVDVYTKIADDNLAKQVSSSWGSAESQNTSSFLNSENAVFQQMAAQGQSIYAAAGDDGAYDDGSTLSVDDPGSQPYVVSAGGTTLSVNSNGSYKSESSWGITGSNQQGGGGGISSTWPIPSWQAGLATAANKGSSTMRMVPDISLNANPQTGYAVYVAGAWDIYGGTSCAAPLWAAFTALANQQRLANNLPVLGFPNLAIYQLGQSSLYSQLFNDIKDGSTNLYYPAVSGYDLSTGFGSFNATALISNLAGSGSAALVAPTDVTVVPHNQIATISWPATGGALSYIVSQSLNNAGPFEQVSGNVIGNSYTAVGLQNGTAYYFEVEAQNINSHSVASVPVSVTPTLMVPQAPGNISISVGGN
jgi:kumamolisin